MSDSTAQEPTMEEILASIRRIISEDDAPAATPSAEAARSPPAPTHQPSTAPAPDLVDDDEDEEDVLELTQPFTRETHGDIDVFEAPKPPPEPVKVAAPPASPPPPPPAPTSPPAMTDDEPLVSGSTEDKAASHFGMLAQSIALPASGRTLEDLVREMMRPMLKEWLDQNLTGIVEARVQAEVERVSRRRV